MSIFNSKSVILRPIEKSDFDCVFSWENDERNWIQSGINKPYKVEEIKAYVSNPEDLKTDGQTRFIVQLNNGSIIGCADLFDYKEKLAMTSVGLLIDEKFRENGYGFEVLNLLGQIAKKNYNLKVLKALILSENTASVQLFKKNGFLSDDTKAGIYTYRDVDYLQLAFFKIL